MVWCARAWAVWCALLVAHAAGYTVDCNHEYTDCDIEITKASPDEETSEATTIRQHALRQYTLPETTETSQVKEDPPFHEPDRKPQIVHSPEPRLINLNVEDLQKFANSLHNQSIGDDKGNKKLIADLSDINLDEDDEDDTVKTTVSQPIEKMSDKFFKNLQAPFNPLLTMEIPDELESCKENGIAYKPGERIIRGCEETCECTINGVFDCVPRCRLPYIRRGRRLEDPLCFESPVDECCSIVACTTHADQKAVGPVCRYGNDTYTVGSTWNVDCDKVCRCEKNSVVNCTPRCNPLPQSDKCINVQDPNDSCCEIQVCDVSHDVHEEPVDNSTSYGNKPTTRSTAIPLTTEDMTESDEYLDLFKTTQRPLVLAEPIGSVVVLQNNSVQVNLMHLNNSKEPIHLLLSDDKGKTFRDVVLHRTNLILDLKGGKDYILKTKETGTKFNFTITASSDPSSYENNTLVSNTIIGCHQDGKLYSVGEEFLIGCKEICECTGLETRECAALDCPSHVGLELISKGCVRWAPSPPAEPPNCCPRAARCLSDGTCHYKGLAIPNWTEVPLDLTGCEERCFCENGELDCQEVCSPLADLPPQTLRCPPMHRPAPVNVSDDDCCKQWGCLPNHPTTLPPGIVASTNLPPFLPTAVPDTTMKLTVLALEADSPTSIKMLFGLPSVLVGLSGSVDLRYTDKEDEDIRKWNSEIFAPANEVLSTSRLEFYLTGLKPSTTYKIRAKLYLHSLAIEPESEIFSVRTIDQPLKEEEKRREIDSRLTVVDVNDTTAHVSWRHFTEDELQYIDGIQVRYRPVGTPIYLMTELLHHSRSTAELQDLRPSSKYEASLVLVPPPRSHTELLDPGRVEFTTAPYVDPYNWSVTIEVRAVGSEAAEMTWRGVPSPAERWVRVYRAAHACQNDPRRENDAFRLAARDVAPVVTLTGLKPDTRCRVWLELFLTNGKVKTSNVVEINTKSLDLPEPIDNEIAQSSMAGGRGAPRNDYYGALVVVGVVAALGAVTSLLLLLVVVRRHRPRSVPITPVPSAPRESSLPPYDNPAYKLELQQETMDL